MLNLMEQGCQLMEENEQHMLKMNREDGKVREERFKNKFFIATAAYGDFNAWEVISLRNFRDHYLLKRMWGRFLVEIYYQTSPPVAKYLENHSKLSNYAEKFLNNLLKYINRQNRY
ncbi:MAG: CFI-box-CTERM domain-containing protein [Methanobacteriaceae archaeon]|nr:CFI-box-CTERM domain-containing protein [Methanobacteriaceae archaeon]MDP3622979.1 CFI-box-CTERM domain-containing protein [Methanobacteriaceae archaeon]